MNHSLIESDSSGELLYSKYVEISYEVDYKNAPTSVKLRNILAMICNASKFYLSMIPRVSLFKASSCCIPDGKKIAWKPGNRGLFVIIHGLKGSPKFSAVTYQEQIHKIHPEYEVRVPYVPHKGNCPLHQAADPILKIVLDYIEQNPKKPINLIGISNGARIAGYIETSIRNIDVDVRVTGIAGVYFGSIMMNSLVSLHIASCVLHRDVISDLQVGSNACKQLIEKMQQSSMNGVRAYEFHATVNDSYIPNFSSCFPVISGAKYHLHTGQDHVSLSSFIRDAELQRSFEWMESMLEDK